LTVTDQSELFVCYHCVGCGHW